MNRAQIQNALNTLTAERVQYIRKPRKGAALEALKTLEAAIQHLEILLLSDSVK